MYKILGTDQDIIVINRKNSDRSNSKLLTSNFVALANIGGATSVPQSLLLPKLPLYRLTCMVHICISVISAWSRVVILAGVIIFATISVANAADSGTRDPLERWALDFESGALFSVGSRTSRLNYILMPQIFSLRSGAFIRYSLRNGTLVVRSRFSMLIEPIVRGPENYFVGFSAAPSIEWWNSTRTFSVFLSVGGGFGWMDSKGHKFAGAQGQDFNLNWFMHGGVRLPLTDQLVSTAGLYFQHISNAGMNDVNPGIDSLGPTIGIGWQF